ncbi:MAG TPA: alpha-hydroxy acid oxidase [Acidimicrobiales bacterium]|jgi:4-hydroxymandelate oxidase|nr:alpha-hydroxy acid oxidase [Acidimicrobiales bacterium]
MTTHPVRPQPATPIRSDTADGVRGAAQLDLELLERTARQVIGEMAYAYYAGAADQERQLADNVAAWSRWQLYPRVLVDVSGCSTATTILGQPVRSPVLVAPTAIQGLAHPDAEVGTALGAAATGTCLVLSSLATRRLEEIAEAAPDGLRWMQVYVLRDRGATAEMVTRAAAAGYRALVLTVDAPVSGLRRRELREGVHLPDDLVLPNLAPSITERAREGGFMAIVGKEFDQTLDYEDISWLTTTSGLPVVVKGVLRADDAIRCLDAGAAAVIVSNHGARQLDDGPATADVVAEVADAVGDRAEVYVDGGIRRPPDVLKALALGARAVLVGRPIIWSLATGGAEGVAATLDWFQQELLRTMALCGTPTVADVDRSLIRRPAP